MRVCLNPKALKSTPVGNPEVAKVECRPLPPQGLLSWLLKGGIDNSPLKGVIDVDVEVDVDIDRYFGCLNGASKSVQVLLYGIEAVMVLTLIILK